MQLPQLQRLHLDQSSWPGGRLDLQLSHLSTLTSLALSSCTLTLGPLSLPQGLLHLLLENMRGAEGVGRVLGAAPTGLQVLELELWARQGEGSAPLEGLSRLTQLEKLCLRLAVEDEDSDAPQPLPPLLSA